MKAYWILILGLLTTPAWADAELAAGQAIFDQYCAGACHQAPVPERLSANQWRVVLKTMQKRMRSRGMEPLTEQETAKVFRYLTAEDSAR